MADKMMRIAGRSGVGLAKPIKTDETGKIELACGSVDVITRTGALAVGAEEAIFNFSVSQPIEILALSVSFLRPMDGAVELFIRDKTGEGKVLPLITPNGVTTASVNPQNVKDLGSALWCLEKIRSPETNSEFLLSLKNLPFLMPNGGVLRIRNNNTISINVGVQVLYRKWGNF
ncbi:hypothetical protein KQ224_04865 [Streptococcus parasuis]|uniref:hypothetical protein n=1 Tax=Streptococcus parasuis TaxID=1501662 RepID=UPI001C1FDE6C|nr:hypothetical protein [Streptococcus parasuis]QWV87410.1 hypothetical protein KQ224_04865 [Streptococcus parasuis]